MSWNRLSILFVSALAGVMVVTATAQQTGVPSPPASATTVDPASEAWNVMAREKPPGKLVVVTVGEPGVRHSCRVRSISEQELTCKKKWGHTTAYASKDVAVLYASEEQERVWPYFLGLFGLSGGAAAAAYFVASITLVGAVPLAVIAGVLFLFTAGPAVAAVMGTSSETVYYQRYGTTLSGGRH